MSPSSFFNLKVASDELRAAVHSARWCRKAHSTMASVRPNWPQLLHPTRSLSSLDWASKAQAAGVLAWESTAPRRSSRKMLPTTRFADAESVLGDFEWN